MSIEASLKKVEELMANSMWEDAIYLCDDILAQDSSNVDALYFKGQILSNIDKFQEAVYLFDRVLKIVGNESDYGANVLVNKGCTLIEQDNLDEADSCFDNALRIKPRLSRAWLHKGRIEARRKNYEKSLELCDRALSLDPIDPRPWNNKAFALFNLSRLDECIRCAKKAIDLRPNYFMSYLWLSKAYEKKGKKKKAYKYFLKFQEHVKQRPIESTKGQKYNKAL